MLNETMSKQVRQTFRTLRGAVENTPEAMWAAEEAAGVRLCVARLAFHAVQAVLYDRGLDPSSHGAVRSLYGSEVIAAGDAVREDGRFLSRLSEPRQVADYG